MVPFLHPEKNAFSTLRLLFHIHYLKCVCVCVCARTHTPACTTLYSWWPFPVPTLQKPLYITDFMAVENTSWVSYPAFSFGWGCEDVNGEGRWGWSEGPVIMQAIANCGPLTL